MTSAPQKRHQARAFRFFLLVKDGDLAGAAAKFSDGLAAAPRHGAHLLLCNRSAVFLQLGRREDALADALAALRAAPPGGGRGGVRKCDEWRYGRGRREDARVDALAAARGVAEVWERVPRQGLGFRV
eukprot:130992-Chlamydomonas_euryale.AAC.9